MNKPYYYFILFYCLCLNFAYAQQKLTGTVFNEKAEPVGDVLIRVGQSEFIKTNRNGSFQVTPKVIKQKYEATDFVISGYRVKRLEGNSPFNVFVTPATQIRGKVIDKLKRKRNFRVLLQEENESEQTHTQPNGDFVLNNIPVNTLANASQSIKFWVDDVQVDAKHIRFENNNTLVFLSIPNEEKPSDEIEFYMEEILPKKKENNAEIPETANSIVDEFNKINENLLDDRQEQQRRAKRLKNELTSLTDKLLATKNISKSERENLLKYANLLEATFSDNDSLFSIFQSESKAEINKMQRLVQQKDSLRNIAERKTAKVEAEKQQIQAEKELNELRFRTNIFILSVILFALICVIFIFFFYNRIIRKQRNELQTLSNKLSEKVEEVNQQNEEILTQRDDLDAKGKQLEYAYSQIKSSIVSAERIQNAILDSTDELLEHFADGFVLYYPRDIVSGDFYWCSKKEQIITLGVIDCTGHGVPGAFMTMLGHSLLNYIINEQNISHPNEILTRLDSQVHQALHQNNREDNYVGMDMALICLDYANQVVRFAGAKHYALRYSKGQVFEIKGAKFPIGITKFKTDYHFEEQTFPLVAGDCYYLQSDGLEDQIAQVEGKRKKFSKKRYVEFLTENHTLPFPTQRQKLEKDFKNWQDRETQTDDVTVVGIKVK